MKGKHRGKQAFKRSENEAKEIEALESQIAEGAPLRVGEVADGAEQEDGYANCKKFADLPVSNYTKLALKESKFVNLTAIQKCAVPQALCGRDVLGAAKTGSGKTLAFIIPVIETLYRQKWGRLDGLGALIISPTRELALQIFNELRKVGKHHDLSAGLLIGGKNLKEERGVVGSLNILICTPGRLLQHMDETPNFDASGIQVLVLDEADRILDMGFSAAVNAIVENLPQNRQTLLFSATQTKSVKQLARLSLKDPQYVSVHENAAVPTPVKLEQAYAIVELQDKLNVLWSFIRSHIKAKILVFASTCKQVKFLYEAFSRLRPGCPLRSLHGGMKQMKRMAVFYDFAEASSGMVLFATDIAARGLDFAKLDWVIQLDCPEDVPAYIHRVGRTARYVSAGRGLLMLCPSEAEFLKQLEESKVPVKGIKINPSKTQPISPALQALLSKNQELKESAQRSITSYLKSVFLAPNKAVFDVNKLPIVEYALSLGLSAPPKLRFIKKAAKNAKQKGEAEEEAKRPVEAETSARGPESDKDDSPEDKDDSSGEEHERQPSHLELQASAMLDSAQAQPPGEDLLRIKARVSPVQTEMDVPTKEKHTKRKLEESDVVDDDEPQGVGKAKKKKKMKIRVGDTSGSRIVFDQDGVAMNPLQALAMNDDREEDGAVVHLTAAERFAKAAAALKVRDAEDKCTYQDRKRAKAQEKRAKQKLRDAEEREEEAAATLGPGLGFPGQEDIEGRHDGPAMRDQSDDSEGDMDWDSDDSDALKTLQKKSRAQKLHPKLGSAVEKAHLGMSTKQPQQSSSKPLSLKEQEDLALKLLAGSA